MISLTERVTNWRSRDGAVLRALASHYCGPGLIPALGAISGQCLLSVLVVLRRCFLRVFRFPPSTKTNTSKFQFYQDTGPASQKPPQAELVYSQNSVLLGLMFSRGFFSVSDRMMSRTCNKKGKNDTDHMTRYTSYKSYISRQVLHIPFIPGISRIKME